MTRVVITGAGVINALGNSLEDVMAAVAEEKCGTRYMASWLEYKGLKSLVGAPADLPDMKGIPRRMRRSMGRMSLLAVAAANEALRTAGIGITDFTDSKFGCVAGSTMGSSHALTEAFETMLPEHDLTRLTAMKFFQCISHTVAMNIAQYLGIIGEVVATSSACASALQAVGTGFELIRSGKQTMVLCGGAEELHPTVTGSFDILFATSAGFNDAPHKTPRPFDKNRDGLVCGEGAGLLMLESHEHAVARGAKILAEVVGYNTCGSGTHITQPDRAAMVRCMNAALDDADLKAQDVDFINAHATATLQGDTQEALAISDVFGADVPVNSLKGYFGHTLGASGAIELACSIAMMNQNRIYPTLNLENVDPGCEGIFHVTQKMEKDIQVMLKNCFAFGGINAALVCRKYDGK